MGETLILKEISGEILRCAIEVHRALGPDLLESAYHACLADELSRAGLSYFGELPIPVLYRGRHLDCGYRVDFLVEKQVIVELKSIQAFAEIHSAQLLTYMRLANKPVGLMINFNVPVLKDGILRKVLSSFFSAPIAPPR